MEEYGNIIIILLAVVFWIVSAIAGANKKKAAAAQQEAEREREWAGSNNPTDPRQPDRERLEEPAVPELWPIFYDQQPDSQEAWSYDREAVQRSGQISQDYVFGSTQKRIVTPVEIPDDIPAERRESSPASINTNTFNLTDAVIYSEILKPKFKEE